MKKKVKLFSTIASLCLAVALMAFGVWAASTANFGVTSTVKYTLSGQINATINIKVTFSSADHVTVDDAGMSQKKTGIDEGTYEWELVQLPGASPLTTVANTVNLGGYTFNKDAQINDTVVYTITITNNNDAIKNSEQLFVKITDNAEPDTQNAITREAELKNDTTTVERTGSAVAVDVTKSLVYKVTFKLTNASKASDELTFAPTFALNSQA
ncbi:MAG: hypothetical protein SOV27_02200 [Eubacteriales bacterium]|nr:hypothetical protein [Eubacteriales bacterium]